MSHHLQDPPSNAPEPDDKLARRMRELYKQHFDRLAGLAGSLLAGSEFAGDGQDVATKALEGLWLQMKKGRQISNPTRYLKRSVRNECRNRLNPKRRRQPPEVIGLSPGVPEPVAEPVVEDDEYPLLCRRILNAAGFLQPPDVKPTLYDLLTGEHRSGLVPSEVEKEILQLTGRRDIDVQSCRDFLKVDVEAARQDASWLIRYRTEAERPIKERLPDSSSEARSLLVDAHMVASPWPGWPPSSLKQIVDRSHTPPWLVHLAAALDHHRLRANEAVLFSILDDVAREMSAWVLHQKWPPSGRSR